MNTAICNSCGLNFDPTLGHICIGTSSQTSPIISNGYSCNSCGQYIYYGTMGHTCTSQNPSQWIPTSEPPYDHLRLESISVIESILGIRKCHNEKGKCSSCKKDKELVLAYKVIKLERRICEKCLLKVADKIFEVKGNAALENSLYGK